MAQRNEDKDVNSSPSATRISRGDRASQGTPSSARFSHGRGPLMNDSDDSMDDANSDDELLPTNISSNMTSGTAINNIPVNNTENTASSPSLNRKTCSGFHRLCCSCASSCCGKRNTEKKCKLSLRTTLGVIIVGILTILLIVFSVFHIIIGAIIHESIPSGDRLSESISAGLVLDVQNVGVGEMRDSGIDLMVDARAGINVDKILGWDGSENDWKRHGLKASIIRSAIHRSPSVIVNAQNFYIADPHKPHIPLLSVSNIDDLDIPLYISSPSESTDSYSSVSSSPSWLQTFHLALPLEVSHPATLLQFLNSSLHAKNLSTVIGVQSAEARPASFMVQPYRIENFSRFIPFSLPDIPSVLDPSKLIKFRSSEFFLPDSSTDIPVQTSSQQVYQQQSDQLLGWRVNATFYNPLTNITSLQKLKLNFDIPWSLKFGVFLPASGNKSDDFFISSAQLPSLQISTTTKAYDVSIVGSVASLRNMKSSDDLLGILSKVVNRFMLGQPNTAIVRPLVDQWTHTPKFLDEVFKNLRMAFTVPGSADKDNRVLQNVRIENMKMVPTGEGLYCSGTVIGELDLPQEIKSLEEGIKITAIQPDVLVYDGKLPKKTQDPEKDETFPPDPLPANSFARLECTKPVDAKTDRKWDKERQKYVTTVTAQLDSIPVQLLEGRESVFQRYLGKIMFQNGVETGVRGISDVNAAISGIGDLKLKNIAVEGMFRV